MVEAFMAIKVDLAKAYDQVEWGVLETILKCFGFNARIIFLIMSCITTPKFSILLNDSPYGFLAGRGLR